MYYTFGAQLKELAKGVTFSDATDAIDHLKAIKSAEEFAFIRRVAAMQDQVFVKLAAHIRPGMKDFEVAAYAQYIGQLLGSEQGIFLAGSAPASKPVQQPSPADGPESGRAMAMAAGGKQRCGWLLLRAGTASSCSQGKPGTED
jgi:hypothetical protein